MSLYLRISGKGVCQKLTSLLSVVSKVFEKLVNDRLVDHVEKSGPLNDFQYVFRSFRSNAGFLTFASDTVARLSNRSVTTRAVALDVAKAFDKVWYADIWPYSVLSSVLDGFEWFWMEVFTRISS